MYYRCSTIDHVQSYTVQGYDVIMMKCVKYGLILPYRETHDAKHGRFNWIQ